MSYLKAHDEHVSTDDGWTADIVYMESYLGSILIEQCTVCDLLWVSCEHEKNTWDKDGARLTCDLCGTDVT